MDAKITVTAISSSKISLLEAYTKTVGTVIQIAERANMSKMCEDILEKKQDFYNLEKLLPASIKENV